MTRIEVIDFESLEAWAVSDPVERDDLTVDEFSEFSHSGLEGVEILGCGGCCSSVACGCTCSGQFPWC